MYAYSVFGQRIFSYLVALSATQATYSDTSITALFECRFTFRKNSVKTTGYRDNNEIHFLSGCLRSFSIIILCVTFSPDGFYFRFWPEFSIRRWRPVRKCEYKYLEDKNSIV